MKKARTEQIVFDNLAFRTYTMLLALQAYMALSIPLDV